MKNYCLKHLFCLFLLIIASACQHVGSERAGSEIPHPKNIIYFISDGMGYNHVLATNYYHYGEAGVQVYEQPGWLHLAQATYNVARISRGDTIFANGYAPRKAWKYPDYFSSDYTDSGSAATALSTGQKTISAAIGISIFGDTLTHISQAAKAIGKSIGIVSSVPFSHATPAGFIAHNHSRHNYDEISHYMLFNTRADVIMAPGNPFFDNDGQPVEEPNYRYVGTPEIWDQLVANEGRTQFTYNDQVFYVQDVDGNGARDPWTYIEERDDFLALIEGPAPRRVLGVPQAYATLNQGRSRDNMAEMPFEQPMNTNVPTLEEMTKASLNVLAQNSNGFFVMIEGGAIDWASHDNHLGRMIEEQTDFNNAVQAAVNWVETHSSWDETLVIVTSDHECGYLTGPKHPNPVNDPVVNMGKGNLPQAQWNHSSHTNMLVPFYAKGPGVELFQKFAGEIDPMHGHFLQNTDIANAIFLMWGKPDIAVHRLTY